MTGVGFFLVSTWVEPRLLGLRRNAEPGQPGKLGCTWRVIEQPSTLGFTSRVMLRRYPRAPATADCIRPITSA